MQETDLKFRSLWIIIVTIISFCYAQTIVSDPGIESVAQDVQLVGESTTIEDEPAEDTSEPAPVESELASSSPEPSVDEADQTANDPEPNTETSTTTLALAAVDLDSGQNNSGPSLAKSDSNDEQLAKETSTELSVASEIEEDSLLEESKASATDSTERVVAAKESVAEVAEIAESDLAAAVEKASDVVDVASDTAVETAPEMTASDVPADEVSGVPADEVSGVIEENVKEIVGSEDVKPSASPNSIPTTSSDKALSTFDAVPEDSLKEVAKPVLPADSTFEKPVNENVASKRPKKTSKPKDEVDAAAAKATEKRGEIAKSAETGTPERAASVAEDAKVSIVDDSPESKPAMKQNREQSANKQKKSKQTKKAKGKAADSTDEDTAASEPPMSKKSGSDAPAGEKSAAEAPAAEVAARSDVADEDGAASSVKTEADTEVANAKDAMEPEPAEQVSGGASDPSPETVDTEPELAPEVDSNAPPVPPGLSDEAAENLTEAALSKKPWLGLRLDQPTPRIDKVYPGSGAADTDIKPGDVIVGINDEEPLTTDEIVSIVTKLKASETITVAVQRDTEELKFEIFLGKPRPAAPTKDAAQPK